MYASQVRQFGSAEPYIIDGEHRFNLRTLDKFEPAAVVTDKAGNVIDMPLLRGRPCFGRIERFNRAMVEAGTFKDKYGFQHVNGRCAACPVFEACAKVCDERMASAPAVRKAFDRFLEAAGDRIHGVFQLAGREWDSFLTAIERHGGWECVNDARVIDYEAAKAREAARAKVQRRKARRAAQRGRNESKPITPDIMARIDAARDERLQRLRDIHGWRHGSRSITKLPADRLELHADAWRAKVLLERMGRKPTGKALAESLTARGEAGGIPATTLVTVCCNALRRIRGWEKINGNTGPVWSEFTP